MDMEVLIATMGQKDCSLVQKMNIKAPAAVSYTHLRAHETA